MKTLLKYHAPLYVTKTAPGDFDITPVAGQDGYNDGWTKLDGLVFASERILDCAGLAMEEETLFFDGITVQEGGTTNTIAGGAGDSYITFDIVSTVPLNLGNDFASMIFFGAGFPGGGVANFEHIPYAKNTRYTLDLDTAAAFAFKVSSEQYGSMEPTASDRLYVYRMVFIYDTSTTGITGVGVNGARVLFAITTKEEATYQYLMRLKRSYELQQGRDED
jgi:hypothetical protein